MRKREPQNFNIDEAPVSRLIAYENVMGYPAKKI
jgi:hypothetical protein